MAYLAKWKSNGNNNHTVRFANLFLLMGHFFPKMDLDVSGLKTFEQFSVQRKTFYKQEIFLFEMSQILQQLSYLFNAY